MSKATPAVLALPWHGDAAPAWRGSAERLLAAVVGAARSLVAHDDLYAGLAEAMQRLGEASGHDRAYVFRMREELQATELVAEWNAPGIATIASLWGGRIFPDHEFEEVIAPLRRGLTYQGQPATRTGRNAQLNTVVGNASDVMVPVFADGQFWGMVGLDHCRDPYQFEAAEVDALRGAAEAVAAAVQRSRARAAHAASEALRIAQAEADNRLLRSREALLAAVGEATRHLVAGPDLASSIAAAIDALRQGIGVGRVFVNRYAPDEQATYFWMESRASGVPALVDGFGPGPWPDAEFAEVALPLREGRIYRSLSHQRSGRNAAANDVNASLSDLIVPIVVDGRYRACIGFDDHQSPRDWNDSEVAVLGSAAHAIAAAIARDDAQRAAQAAEARRAEEAQGLIRLFAGVVEASRRLHEHERFDDALEAWLETIARPVGADSAYFGIIDEQGEAQTRAGWRVDRHAVGKDAVIAVPIPRTSDFRDWVDALRAGDVVGATIDELKDPASQAFWRTLDRAAALVAPLRQGGRTIGWVGFDAQQPVRWSDTQIAVLRTAADVLCAAIQREEARRTALAERERRIDAERERAEAAARHAEHLGRHAALLAAVARAADEMLATRDLLGSVDAALRHIGPVARAQRACLALLEWTPGDPAVVGWQHIRAEWTAGGAARQIDGPLARFAMRRDDPTWAALFDTLRRDGRVLARCDEWDEPARGEQRSLGVEWTVAHPVEVGGTLRALLGFDFGTPFESFDEADHAALKTLASVIANAMVRAESEQRAIDAERERADDNERLARLLSHVVQSSRTLIDAAPEEFETRLLEWLGGVGRGARAQRATFYDIVTFEATGTRTVRMLCEWVAEGVGGSIPVSFAEPWVVDPRGGEAEIERMVSGLPVAAHLEDMHGIMRAFFEAQGNATVFSVPVYVDGRQWGTISFDFAERQEMADSVLAVLQTAADTLAAVLRRNEAVRALLAERETRLETERLRTRELRVANEAIAEAVSGLVRGSDLESFLDDLLCAAIEACGAQSGTVTLLEGHVARQIVRRLPAGALHATERSAPSAEPITIDVEAIGLHFGDRAVREAVFVPADAAWIAPSHRTLHRRIGNRLLGLVPLNAAGRTIGWLGLGLAGADPPPERVVALLRVLADQMTVALELGRLAAEAREAAVIAERERAAEQRAAELARANQALRRSVARLADSRDLQSFLVQLVDEARRMLGAGVAQIFLYDPATHTLRASVGVSESGTRLDAPGVLAADGTDAPFDADITPAWRRMLAAGAPVDFDLERDAADFWPATLAYHRRSGHRGSLCTAMRLGDLAIGVFGIARPGPAPYTTMEHELLQVFAQQAALAIQTDRYADEARAAAVAREREIAQRTRLAELARANDALRNATLSLTPGAPIADFLAAVLLECTAIGGARSGGAFVFDEADGGLRMTAFVSDGKALDIATDPRMAQWRAPVPPAVATAWIAAIADVEQLAFDNRVPPEQHPWPISRDWHASFGHTHVIDVPLYAGGQLVGLLGQCFCGDAAAARFDLAHTQALAHLAALAVYQQRLAEAARLASVEREREQAEHARLLELSRANDALRVSIDALAETDDEEAFLRRSLHQIAAHAGAKAVWLFRTTGGGALVRLVGSSRDGRFSAEGEPGDPPLFRTARIVSPIAARRMRAHGRLLWRSLTEPIDPDEYQPEVIEWHRRLGHRANALHGLMIGPRQVGMIGMVFDHDRRPSDSQQELIHALCQPLALALELMRLGRDSRRSAERAAVLAERNRLAREIHDGIAQSFLAIQMRLGGIDAGPAPAPVAQALDLARHGLTEARRAVAALRPQSLLDRSLPEAVAAALSPWTAGADLHVQVDQPAHWQPLPPEAEDHLFRLVQEAVHNVVKHARARNLRIEINQGLAATSILVADDGVGFDLRRAAGGFGLESMQQRARLIAAQLQWQSAPGAGTQVLVSLATAPAGTPDDTR